MADRGELFVEVGTPVYTGMIVGERNRNGDLEINITKEKKLGNMRSSTAEATVTLRPPRPFSLDQSIEFIAEDELVEVTPENIRLRKIEMDATRRLQERRRDQKVAESEDE
jgi:GTP-binding protein